MTGIVSALDGGRSSPTPTPTPLARIARSGRSVLKYTDVIGITVRSRMAYIWDLVGSSLFLAVIMFVFVQLWTLTFRSPGTVIVDFTLKQMIWYFVACETIIMSMLPIHRTLEREIREGDVALRLNKPYSYLLFHGSVFLGEAMIKSLVLIFIGGAVAFATVGGFEFQFVALPALIATYVLTWAINFCYSSLIGLAAFWIEDVTGLYFIFDRAKWLLGGFLLPVSLFPEPLATIAKYLPFRYMIYEPARLVVDFTWTRWLEVTGLQLVCFAIFGLLSNGIYRLGVRRLNLNGG